MLDLLCVTRPPFTLLFIFICMLSSLCAITIFICCYAVIVVIGWIISATIVAAYYLGGVRGVCLLFKFEIQSDLVKFEQIRAHNIACDAHKNNNLKRQQSNVRAHQLYSAPSNAHGHTHTTNGVHHVVHNVTTVPDAHTISSPPRSTESPAVSQIGSPHVNAPTPTTGATGSGSNGRAAPVLHLIEVKPASSTFTLLPSFTNPNLNNETVVPLIPLPSWQPSWYVRQRRFIQPKSIRRVSHPFTCMTV
jgi:hypothetical protein